MESTKKRAPLKLIIIEEDEYFALHLVTLLKAIGCEVISCVHNLDTALTTVSKSYPDMIVMAIDNPKKKEILIDIRSIQDPSNPILFVTNFRKSNFYNNSNPNKFLNPTNLRKAIRMSFDTFIKEKQINVSNFITKEYLFFTENRVFSKVKIEDILYFRATEDYTFIHTPQHVYTAFLPFKHIKKLFEEKLFLETHRSYMINTQKDISVDSINNKIYINYDSMVPISRRMKSSILDWFKGNNTSLLP